MLMDAIGIKEMQWVTRHFSEAGELATHYYSNQWKDHEYLELPDSAYLRYPGNREIPGGHLPALTGAESFKLLPVKIEVDGKEYRKNLEELESGSLVLKYGGDLPPIIEGVGMITIGKNLANLCFDMMTRLVEAGLVN